MKASDPRDKIFALLAFGEETHRIAHLPDLIRPSYTKSLLQVYVDFTRWWVHHYGSLKILSAVHTLRGRSWLDFSAHNPSNDTRYNFESQEHPSWTLWTDGQSEWIYGTLALGDDSITYNACGDRPIYKELLDTSSINPCVLPVKGIHWEQSPHYTTSTMTPPSTRPRCFVSSTASSTLKVLVTFGRTPGKASVHRSHLLQ